MTTKNFNYALSAMAYFIMLSIMVYIVGWVMFQKFTPGVIPIRIIIAIFFSSRWRIRFINESNDDNIKNFKH